MSFDANVWDDKLDWNSLIHPFMGKPKSQRTGKLSIRDKALYKEVAYTGELEFDLKNEMREIRHEMNDDQIEYDLIKATEAPYKWLAAGYIVFLILLAVGSYLGATYFKVNVNFIVWANVVFFVVQTVALGVICFFCLKQEEVRDCVRLCTLTNCMREKVQKQRGQERLYLKMMSEGSLKS